MNNQKKNTQKYLSKKHNFCFLICIEKKKQKRENNYKYLQVPPWKLISEGQKILRYF